MSAYVIASYSIVNPKGYEPYVPSVVPLLAKHGAEILVADFESKPLEGKPPTVTIVLRFASEAAAMDWYNDPDYSAIKKYRIDNSENGMAVLCKQFTPPDS